VKPIVIVLLDGLGDRAYPELGGRSSNEAAHTPNLDRLCARGSCGLLTALGPGRAPSSELAHWAMLGYRPDEFPGRAVLERRGAGMPTSPDRVYAFAALRPAERHGGELWLTGRPRRGDARDEADAAALLAACADLEARGLRFTLAGLSAGEAILELAGDVDDRVTDSDAFFRDRHPLLCPRACAPAADRTAAAAEAWTRLVVETLRGHPVNRSRSSDRLPTLDVITLKWWGRPRPAPSFLERHGLRGTMVGGSRFIIGLAATLGLHAVEHAETGDPQADLRDRLAVVEERLAAGDDFVFVHLKALDEAGHTKDPRARLRTIESLDAALGRAPVEHAILCVTGDHCTPASRDVIHSGDPVPVVLAGPGVARDRVERFGELDCAAGLLGRLQGPDLMPVLLNAADRPLFLGSRPTPFAHADGHPALYEPLTL